MSLSEKIDEVATEIESFASDVLSECISVKDEMQTCVDDLTSELDFFVEEIQNTQSRISADFEEVDEKLNEFTS